jgi:hypothetical protein
MKKKEVEGKLKGVKNGRSGPAISHLLFADDSIFFTRGDAKNLQALNDVLQTYSQGSGQRINFGKSSVFFGDHCPVHIKDRVKTYLNVHCEAIQVFDGFFAGSKILRMHRCVVLVHASYSVHERNENSTCCVHARV